jgi:uncharacterized protein YoxC
MEFLPYYLSVIILCLIIYSIYIKKDLNRLIDASREKDEALSKLRSKIEMRETKIKGLNTENIKLINKLKELEKQIKEQTPDDPTEHSIKELAQDMKAHGFSFIRVNPDSVYLR